MSARRNAIVAWSSAGLVAAMVGLSFAAVPLYDWFCRTTGFGGTVQRAEAPAPGAAEGLPYITVRFNADTARDMPWRFQPVQRVVQVRPGEETLIFYRAHNPTNRPVTGTATFNVSPASMGLHFDKVQCFCFEEQLLKPGETVEMPVSFFLDPKMLEDKNARHVRVVTLSYTFFNKPGDPVRVTAAPAAPAATN